MRTNEHVAVGGLTVIGHRKGSASSICRTEDVNLQPERWGLAKRRYRVEPSPARAAASRAAQLKVSNQMLRRIKHLDVIHGHRVGSAARGLGVGSVLYAAYRRRSMLWRG